MDVVFNYYAYNNDLTIRRSLAFYVANVLNTSWGQLDEIMQLRAEDRGVQYGEHHTLQSASDIHLIRCYRSSDTDEQQDQMMDVWRRVFANEFTKCVVGNVCDVTNVDGVAQMYERTKNMYEQQQAEQLRDRLNANITISASPTAAKKM